MSEPLTAAQRVAIARHPQRPNITDYIQALFTDFFEQKGDRLCGEDAAILGGVALYHGRPVTVIGTRKGKTLEENLKCNFGMPNPEGYRKALRLMRQAEKFRRPILTFIDTSGAYPGLEAEAHGQNGAHAEVNMLFLVQVVQQGKKYGSQGQCGQIQNFYRHKTDPPLFLSVMSFLSVNTFALS